MSKPLIKIFTYVDGVNDTPFPNEENQLIIPEYSFSDNRMGSVNLTATAMYPTCLDDKWVTGKQYADFRGERYFIVKTPSSSKSNDDVRYKHDIEFVSERNILETVYFYDVVSDNTSVDRYVSNSTKVLFYGDVHELVARLNYSLEYSQVAYRIVIDDGITSEVKQVSLEDVFVFDAIQEIFNIFELPFYFVGKTIHVGFTDNAITHTFRYGKDYELLSISKTNANYKITNRVTGTGSSDNIQFYYPNPSNDRAAIEAAGGKWITPAGTLMPPIYRDTDGAERFYNAINKKYINPETGEYYVFENEFTTASQKEQIVTFEDIKPSIKGTLNAAGLRIDQIIDIAFDKDDSDEVNEDTGDYIHPYFYVKLNRFSGDYGFNLFDQPIVGSDASIVMTSGNCNACTFQIGVTEIEENGNVVFRNPVQVDKNGNIAEGNYADKVKVNNLQERQQDTTQYEVWIALKKDNTTFGVVMPNKGGRITPSYGDNFVIINIDMPETYIYKAENELKEAILKYMANNNSEKFTFSIKLSRIFLAENPAIEALINSSARIDLEYNGKYHQLYVSSYTYRSDSEVLPEITIELADTLTISKNSIQTSIDSVKQDIMNTIGGVDFLKQGLKYFLRKDTEDIARFFISFLRGIKIGNYVSGGDMGGIFAVDGNGKTFIETDFLKVRMKAYFETLEIINTGSIAGRQIITPGGSIKCIKVVDREDVLNEDGEKIDENIWDFYRCYFLAEQDGVKVENRFRIKDQALSQDFNIKEGVYENVSNHYYWRLVVGVGDDYIDLSKTDADTKSDVPAVGDVICQLGHRDDKAPERQNAMIFSAVDLYSPSLTMYAGINSYSYVNKDYISYGVDKTTNKAFMNVYGDTYIGDRNRTSYMEFKTGKGLKIKGQLEVGSTIGNGSTIEDALDKATQDAIDAATEDLTNYAKEVTESLNNIQYQIDGQIESFFEKYSPTLTNKPAVDWTTEELKKQHANDTFTNIDTGESWKWIKDGTTWKWSVIEDTATLKALAAASKAQDTADGKRRVFIVKPTTEQAYDVGDLWVNATYGTTYHNDILRAKTAKKAGEAFNISHWELASKYTDDTKANEAAAAAAEAQEAAEQAATAVDNLNTYVDGAFKDGVIEESEAQAIEKYINIVDNAKKTTDAAYIKLYANTYLTGAAKTGLKSAKDKLDIATTNLINSINTAIADGQTTVAEKNDVDAKYAAYNTANESFSTAVEVANGAIQDLLKSYSDQAKEAAVAAQAAADAAQAAADSASDAVDDLNGYVDGAFKDGVIDEAEAKAIEKYINVVNGSKAATDATYTKLYSNKYLLGTAKENLKTAKDKLDVATTALLTSIQSAIADGKTTAEEKAAVDAKYADFNKANEDFNTAIEAANLSIQNMLKSYADAALAAAEAAQTSADAAKTAADNAAGAVGDLNDYVDGAFKDGIIDASEAQAIEKYINIVNNTKGEVKATFDKLYANVYLTGAAKTGLNSSYTALNTAITNLLNSITTAIADGKTTAAEVADVDTKYTSFNTAYSSFNTAVETANKAIQDKLKTFADDAKALAESAQAVADAAKDRLDSWAEDGVISPTEKQGIKDEIARIKADKDNITAGYKLYNLGEATAYNTAYTDYYNSLLVLSDTTKETIEIPTDFATKQTKYYTERTTALNAIASASKSAVDAAQAAADAAKSRLDSWAADGVISPAEKQSIKDERARILADKADITAGYTRYKLGNPTDYNTAYTAYDTQLAALSKDTPEVITIPSDFATKQKNYYDKRTAAISAIDAATKSNADAAAAAAAKAQEDIDSVKTDINKINSDVAGLKNFTDDAFADGVVDRGEASAIGAYLKSIATVKADVDKSYTEVYANPLLAGTAKTTLNTTYTAFGKAVKELTTAIEAVVEKGTADSTDRSSVNGKYDTFNTKYGDFVASLNAANTYIQDQIESKAQSALAEAVSYRYLKKAFSEYTIIEGGLVQNSLNVLGYTNDKKEFVVQAGMNGIYDASQTHGGIAAWYGGSMKDYFDYTDLTRPKDVAKGVDRMDGTGYRANGNLWWDENGTVHADPLSFFVGTETVGGLLASFQVVMTNKEPDYLIPKVPFQKLTIANNLTVGGDIILKDGILKWDSANNAFYVEKKDGSIASFYATGEVSAGGVGSGGSGGGGGGLIENVYGSSSLGDDFSDSDLNNTFNAYSINQIYSDVKNLKSGAAVSLVTNGTGTVLTNIVKTGSVITATKGNLSFSALTSKPTTIAGYGITNAYTKTESDGKYPLKAGTGATGTWGIDVTGYSKKLSTNQENAVANTLMQGSGLYYNQVSSTTDTGYPSNYGQTIRWQRSTSSTLSSSQAVVDLFHATGTSALNQLYLRTGYGDGSKMVWGSFVQLLHTGNYTSLITKLGTATVGSNTKFFYLNAGTPTASTATVGSSSLPVYMNAGTITQCSTTLGVSITGTAPRLTTTELTNQDLNSYTYTNYSGKLYYAGGGNTTTNVPSNVSAYGLLVWRIASGYTGHMMFDSAGDFRARFHNGTTWSAWDKLAYITDNVASATKLQTARTINGTSFNGTANITTANWGTARNLTIGDAVKSVNGSANVSFSLNEINAAYGRNVTYTGTTTAQGWYRLASTGVGINPTNALFFISVTVSGQHSTFLLQVSTNYSNNPSIIQLGGSNYSTASVDQFRLVYHTTYSTHYAYLEVRSRGAMTDATFNVFLVGRANTTWTLSTALTAGSIPEGYTSKTLTPASASIVAPTFRGALVGNVTGNVTGNLTGNASTATSLQTARTLWGQSFNGTANITGSLLGVESLVARSGRINNFLGYLDNSGNPATGTICITLPNGWTASMNIYEIWIYEYNTTANASVITIGGYNYNGGGTASEAKWANIGYHTKGSYSKGVRVGYNGSKCVILLGTTTTTWNYPKVYLKTIYTGHLNQTIWGGTSTISLITSETGYTNIVSVGRMDEFFGDTSVTGRLAVTGAGHFGYTYTTMTAGINVKGDSATTGISIYDGTGTTARLYRKGDILYITRAGNDASGILMSTAGSIYPGANNTLTNGTTTNRWSGVYTQLLNVAGAATFSSTVTSSGEFRSTSAKAFRAVYGSYGFFIYNDGGSTYFMLTAKDDQYGTYNNLRPLYINNSTGIVTMGHGTNIAGILNGSNTTDATSTTVAAIKTAGGIGVAKQLRVGGAVTFGSTLSVTGQITASGGIRIGNYYLKSTADGLALTHVTTGTIANFYATGEVSAGGAGSGGSGGGGGLIESVYGYTKLNGEYKDTDLNNTFNAYTIAQINKRVVSLEGGSALTVTTTGSGNAVTSVAKSGTAITVTKGTTFVDTTSTQTIGGTKTFSSAIRMGQASIYHVNNATGSNATGSFWYTANYAASQFGIGVYTDKNASPRAFIGWTNASWTTSNNLTVSENQLTYKAKNILHAGNYNDYAPTKTGGGASGSWAISVTGNAATATTSSMLTVKDARGESRLPSYFEERRVTAWFNNVGTPSTAWHSGIHVKGWTDSYMSWELATNSDATSTTNSSLYYRNGLGSTWHAWRTIVDSYNYTSYVLKIGTATVGGTAKPIYLSGGTPTALSATVGSTTVPVYMNAGAITVCSTTLGVSITGNAKTASTLQNTRYIFGKAFSGAGDVAGQALVYGTYTATASSRYTNGGIQVRENGMVGNAQTDDGYAPAIGFHWGNRIGASLILTTSGFKFMNQAFTGYQNVYGIFKGNADSATQVYNTLTNPTSGTWYNVPFIADSNTGNKYIRSNNGLSYYSLEGTASAQGSAMLQLGTSTATGTAGNKRGSLVLYSASSGYGVFIMTTTTGAYTITFPAATGTVALTSSNVASATNADMVDNLHASAFARADQSAAVDLNTVNGKGIMANALNDNATAERHYPMQEAGTLFYGTAAYSSANQIYGTYSTNRWFARGGGSSTTTKTAWKEFAFTTSNVASATKLQTARTLWGQSFNGTANVSGSLTGVGNITSSDVLNIITPAGKALQLKYGGAETSSLVLTDAHFKPFDAATNRLNLGTTSGRWLGVYANTGNFSSTVTGTRFISTVATGTAPLTVSSTTMVTNLNAQMVGGIGVSNIPLEYDASYIPTGTAARWIRIAYFDYSSANYSWSGTFAITNNYSNNENKGLIFTVSTAHGTTSPVITQIGGASGVFTSIRIVKDTTTAYPTTAKVYLEVYYNTTSANNRVYVSYIPANRAIGKWTLYTTYTGGAIPTGHTAIAQLYTTSGLSTTANLRVQGTAVILGTTNHNNRLNIQSDGKIVPYSTATRRSGVYGVYDSTKIGHIWSMGSAYQIADDGANFGNLYGFAYKHINNTTGGTMANGHQAVWCENGTPKVAIGTNFWVANNATIGGTLSVNTLTIKNTEEIGHIKFSRGNFNYITAPASGTIAFVVNGQGVGETTSDLLIQNGVLRAGATNATALGQESHRWSNMYSVLLNVSGVATLYSTVNISGVLNANNATDATSTTAAGAVFDGGVGIGKQLRVGGNVTIAGNVNFANSGQLSVPYSGSTWISLATRTNLIVAKENNSEASAHGLFRVKSFAGDAVVFGGLNNAIGFYGFYKARIDAGTNGSDWATTWNTTTGTLTHNKAMTVSGAVTFNSTLTVASTATFSSTTDATSTTAAAVKVTGGLAVGKQLRVGGAVTLSSTLTVNSTLNVTGVVNANNATDATSTTAASLVCDGGVGVVKQLRVGGATTLSSTLSVAGVVSFTNATDATSTTAAAVKITGGLGVAKQLRVGANAVFTKGIYINGNTTGVEAITLGVSGDKKIKMGAGGTPGNRWSEVGFYPDFTSNGGFKDINMNILAEGTIQISSQAKFIWISGGNIAATGEVSAGSTSDRNLKKNFSLEDYQQRVLDLGMVQDFEYKEEEMKRAVRTYKPGRHTSLIAQDIKACTSMVSKDEDGYLKINPLDKEFLFTVVGAVQLNVLGLREVKSEVETLKEEIKELKKKIEYLERLK